MSRTAPWKLADEPRLRDALTRPWWRLRFEPGLEAQFDDSIAPEQTRKTRNTYFLAIFFLNLFSIADPKFLPDVYQTAWLMRFGVITPLFAMVIWAGFYARQTFRRGVATMIVMLVTSACLMYPVVISRSPDVVHYQVGVVVVLLFGNLLTDLRFALALTASIVFAIMYLLELVVGLTLPEHLITNYGMVMISAGALSLVANFRRERHMREVFVMMALLDIAEQRQAEANVSLQALATRDPLTGLANRRQCDDEFPRLWKEAVRQSHPFAVLFADIDHFKSYNDTYGHASGDEALKRFGDLLKGITARRPMDLAVRIGGEEFLVLLPETSLAAAAEIGRNLCTQLQALAIPNQGSSLGVLTVSVGVVGGVPDQGVQPEDYVEQADAAMYRAKQGGRNRVESSEIVARPPA